MIILLEVCAGGTVVDVGRKRPTWTWTANGPRAQPGAAIASNDQIRHLPRAERTGHDVTTVRQPDANEHLTTVRGFLITIVATVTAASAGFAAGFLAATKVTSFGPVITAAVAVAAGLAATVTTGLAVANGLHKLIRRE
jgi:hypothetical protein